MKAIEFSLILPCYNEAKNLEHLADRLVQVADLTQGEIVLVNNGSSDNTLNIIQSLANAHDCIKAVHVEVNKGYGNGIVSGLRAATGNILGYTHADAQTDPMDAVAGFHQLRARPNQEQVLVKGHRRNRHWFDAIFTVGMGLIESALFQTWMNDIAAQPTVMHRKMFEKWSTPPKDFSLDLFCYVMGKKHGQVFRFDVDTGGRYEGISSWNTGILSRLRLIDRTLRYSIRLRCWGLR